MVIVIAKITSIDACESFQFHSIPLISDKDPKRSRKAEREGILTDEVNRRSAATEHTVKEL